MAEADFEIDFYGDTATDQQSEQQDGPQQTKVDYQAHEETNGGDEPTDSHKSAHEDHDEHAQPQTHQQGTKRKSEEDERPVDPAATSALMISELSWWTTDDDIRGWLRKADGEAEIKELTFSEHKVNGKSKGQAYIEFQSRQAATLAKRCIDQLANDGGQTWQKKLLPTYWNPGVNPFKTLPKDAPARGVKEQPRASPPGPYNERGNFSGGFRGRGGFGNRGNMNQGNFSTNRNYNNNGNMGFNNNMGGGFNGPMGGNFGFNRGNMMGGGMRGGPGGMRGNRGGGNMMGMNPMGGMPMGMPGNMGMMGMGGGMPGFQGMGPNFGGGFGFGQNQAGGGGGGGDWGNPHGAKRPRPE
ncbi:RRM domain protein [Metarhizium album ARSEF 1941]|uniref:RRM domain protein n=1 Tax=Metarhizium album (strain ARSEF 1941) TaxID=1081103 RepID=A0A0B2WXA4_METAS|nr:RRM domain protein [Metarhizium album ARSEF 1941]KHN98673.1 RRM domain protein [Metarhizium album ARSEF 1941]